MTRQSSPEVIVKACPSDGSVSPASTSQPINESVIATSVGSTASFGP